MSTPEVKALADAIRSCNPGDPECHSSVKVALTAAVEACRSEGEPVASQQVQLKHSASHARVQRTGACLC
jgi:hypothetical protein